MAFTQATLPKLPDFDDLTLDPKGPVGNAWGLFGDDDELGMLNLLTPETVAAAAKEIQSGVRISLDLPLNQPAFPSFDRQPFHHEIRQRGADRCVNDDIVAFNTQSSSQWDGFRHYGQTHLLVTRHAILTPENRKPNGKVLLHGPYPTSHPVHPRHRHRWSDLPRTPLLSLQLTPLSTHSLAQTRRHPRPRHPNRLPHLGPHPRPPSSSPLHLHRHPPHHHPPDPRRHPHHPPPRRHPSHPHRHRLGPQIPLTRRPARPRVAPLARLFGAGGGQGDAAVAVGVRVRGRGERRAEL